MIETNAQGGEKPRLPMQGIAQPTRAEVLSLPRVHISQHPVMAHKMTALRAKNTQPQEFYRLVKEIGALLAYEATETLALDSTIIETPLAETQGYRLAGGIGVTPILRAGLGLAEGFREVIPDVQIWHLGLRRDERTLQAMEYYNQLPHKVNLQVCYAVDPMLATGGSAIDAINIPATGNSRQNPALAHECAVNRSIIPSFRRDGMAENTVRRTGHRVRTHEQNSITTTFKRCNVTRPGVAKDILRA